MADQTLNKAVEAISPHNEAKQQINIVRLDLEKLQEETPGRFSFNIFQSAIAISNLILLLPKLVFINTAEELKINWLFIRRDITMSIVPGLLFTTTALVNHPPISLIDGISILASSLIYFWLCITSFCISNQLSDIEEDKINKPDRPLAQGIISYQDAEIRGYVFMMLLTAVAWWLGVLEWAILWQFNFIIHNNLGGAKNWMAKNILSGFGIMSEMGAAWQMVAPISPVVWSWLIILCTACIILISVQDFRDIPGDKAIGRNTFPLVFGENFSRIFVSLCFLIFPVLIHWCLMMPAGNSLVVMLWDIVLFFFSCIIALRLVVLRSYAADHKTYLLFTGWYCLLMTSSIFILRV
ncbi:MAG: UbiA family prenyltransferase [Nostoc sp. ChiSLP02]|nr:UbiA family prenyltransferase [Nostoc sp. DedSLP05]MDZ8103955.1 UbiA family prenyltransferase [Nostoc sp. DedSLP01]MDZ8187175.1 UbiA family prenyltransferase [Nostoc sp. ChiSLP02]